MAETSLSHQDPNNATGSIEAGQSLESQEVARAALFAQYVIKPEMVETVWQDAEPNALVQKIVKTYIKEYGESTGQDLTSWNENEERFEANELKWIADFIVSNLVFVKSDLKMTSSDGISHVLHIFWTTLDLLADQNDVDVAMAGRYDKLQKGIQFCFEERIIDKAQVKQILAYSRRTIFGHLQLYLACINMRKQEQRTKNIEIFQEVPQMSAQASLDVECKEIVEERPLSPEELAARAATEQEEREAEMDEDQDDILDPDDPLYGLDQRLSDLTVNEESKRVIREKLLEASNKIKDNLKQRQESLDSKLSQPPPGKKK